MKNLNRIFALISLGIAALLGASEASAQVNTLIQTSLSAAITNTQQTFQVASVTSLTASSSSQTLIFVDKEAMLIVSIASPTATSITVTRGYAGTLAAPHTNTSVVLAGRPDWFYRTDPTGGCTAAGEHH